MIVLVKIASVYGLLIYIYIYKILGSTHELQQDLGQVVLTEVSRFSIMPKFVRVCFKFVNCNNKQIEVYFN